MVKVISLSEKAYSALKLRKQEGMSFSDVVVMHFGKPAEKTKTKKDLLNWLRSLPRQKKQDISGNIDRVVYGVSR